MVEALEREKELYSVGAADYALGNKAAQNQLLAQQAEDLLANTTARFIETHQHAGNTNENKKLAA